MDRLGGAAAEVAWDGERTSARAPTPAVPRMVRRLTSRATTSGKYSLAEVLHISPAH